MCSGFHCDGREHCTQRGASSWPSNESQRNKLVAGGENVLLRTIGGRVSAEIFGDVRAHACTGL